MTLTFIHPQFLRNVNSSSNKTWKSLLMLRRCRSRRLMWRDKSRTTCLGRTTFFSRSTSYCRVVFFRRATFFRHLPSHRLPSIATPFFAASPFFVQASSAKTSLSMSSADGMIGVSTEAGGSVFDPLGLSELHKINPNVNPHPKVCNGRRCPSCCMPSM